MASLGEPFTSGDSLIHRITPRMRLISAVVLTLPAALLQNLSPALLALAAGVIFVLLARLPLRLVAKRLIIVNFFIFFLWLFIPFSMHGTPVVNFGPLAITYEGIALALLVTVKSNSIVLLLIALMGTISIQDLGPSMQQLNIPTKLCHILLFTYRYIFVIYQEYITMRRAMTARGFKPKTDSHTYRSYAWLVGMLLVKSWDRAERVHGAMRCRGFKGRFYTLTEFSTTTKDYIFITGCCMIALSIIYLEITRRGLV